MYPQCAISRGIHYGLKMIFAIFFCNTYLIPHTDSIGIEWHIIDNIGIITCLFAPQTFNRKWWIAIFILFQVK